MRRNLHLYVFAILAAAAVWASVRIGSEGLHRTAPFSFSDIRISCAIQLDRSSRHLHGLTAGYNYELLKRFASSMGDSCAAIVNPKPGSSWTDSLKQGRVDIVVLPFTGEEAPDSILYSRPLDSLTVWAVRSDRRSGLDEIDSWLETFQASDRHEPLRNLYMHRYNPSRRAERGRKVEHISPYDSLVKAGAAVLGWDWRLLSALIYQESQFHIEFRSGRGAEGLMQMMPATAEKMGVTDLFDPEESLRAGTAYLMRLQNIFRGSAADEDELRKFTLAAYNAGEGRLKDCINYAESVGAQADTWEGIVSIIPELRHEDTIQVDSVLKLGSFHGAETMEYVERVLKLYGDFKAIRP